MDKGTKTYVTKNFQEYEPRYVPKGFNVAEVVEEDNFFKIRYVNDNGQWYYFACHENSHSTHIDTENVETKEIKVGEK